MRAVTTQTQRFVENPFDVKGGKTKGGSKSTIILRITIEITSILSVLRSVNSQFLAITGLLQCGMNDLPNLVTARVFVHVPAVVGSCQCGNRSW